MAVKLFWAQCAIEPKFVTGITGDNFFIFMYGILLNLLFKVVVEFLTRFKTIRSVIRFLFIFPLKKQDMLLFFFLKNNGKMMVYRMTFGAVQSKNKCDQQATAKPPALLLQEVPHLEPNSAYVLYGSMFTSYAYPRIVPNQPLKSIIDESQIAVKAQLFSIL